MEVYVRDKVLYNYPRTKRNVTKLIQHFRSQSNLYSHKRWTRLNYKENFCLKKKNEKSLGKNRREGKQKTHTPKALHFVCSSGTLRWLCAHIMSVCVLWKMRPAKYLNTQYPSPANPHSNNQLVDWSGFRLCIRKMRKDKLPILRTPHKHLHSRNKLQKKDNCMSALYVVSQGVQRVGNIFE